MTTLNHFLQLASWTNDKKNLVKKLMRSMPYNKVKRTMEIHEDHQRIFN